MKKTLLLLFLMPLCMAAGGWEGTAALAIAISAGFLGVAYAAGIGFGVNELQIMAKEEFYQLIATLVLVVLLVGGNNLIDGISSTFGSSGKNLQQVASADIDSTLKNTTNGIETLYVKIGELDNRIALESSRTMSCNIMSIGYTVSACGGYSMLNTPLSMAGGILGFSIGELYSMKRMIAISATYAMQLLLPLGIVLRTFKLTRGAGGFLIALAISMHILLPMGILFNRMLVDTFLASPSSAGYSGGLQTTISEDCDSGNVLFSGLTGTEGQKAAGILHSFHSDLQKVVFSVLVLGTLGPVLALLMMTAGIRALSSMAGAEVDVSALGRFI